MKILVFNGSPKRDKSDTMHLTRAFLDGMNDVHENEVNLIHVIDKHIEFCTGCFSCMKEDAKAGGEGACKQHTVCHTNFRSIPAAQSSEVCSAFRCTATECPRP